MPFRSALTIKSAQRVGKAQAGHFAKSSCPPKKFIREFRLGERRDGA